MCNVCQTLGVDGVGGVRAEAEAAVAADYQQPRWKQRQEDKWAAEAKQAAATLAVEEDSPYKVPKWKQRQEERWAKEAHEHASMLEQKHGQQHQQLGQGQGHQRQQQYNAPSHQQQHQQLPQQQQRQHQEEESTSTLWADSPRPQHHQQGQQQQKQQGSNSTLWANSQQPQPQRPQTQNDLAAVVMEGARAIHENQTEALGQLLGRR